MLESRAASYDLRRTICVVGRITLGYSPIRVRGLLAFRITRVRQLPAPSYWDTMHDFSDDGLFERPPQKKQMHPLVAAMLGIGGVGLLMCGGCFGTIMYIGFAGPETSVYQRADVPESYLQIARSVGGLQPDETIEFFYSDGLVDIKEGFYYASDRKVAIYVQGKNPPLALFPYPRIRSALLSRNESFVNDSEITLVSDVDEVAAFPVSSEMDLDVELHDFILSRCPALED